MITPDLAVIFPCLAPGSSSLLPNLAAVNIEKRILLSSITGITARRRQTRLWIFRQISPIHLVPLTNASLFSDRPYSQISSPLNVIRFYYIESSRKFKQKTPRIPKKFCTCFTHDCPPAIHRLSTTLYTSPRFRIPHPVSAPAVRSWIPFVLRAAARSWVPFCSQYRITGVPVSALLNMNSAA